MDSVILMALIDYVAAESSQARDELSSTALEQLVGDYIQQL